MHVTLIGRSEVLLSIGQSLIERGHTIPLIITSKESPEHRITSGDLKKFAEDINAQFIHTAKINTLDILNEIEMVNNKDIAVSVNYTGIISQNIIDLFKCGVLNAHGGDLPRYKGNACQAWAIINGENEIGLCVHKMIGSQVDEGKIITRAYFPINYNTRVGLVYNWMEEKIPFLIVEAIELLEDNPNFFIEETMSNNKTPLRCYPRLPEDGKIDWSLSNLDILRLINASSEPFSGAFTNFDNKKLYIWRAELIDDNENYLAVNGQISFVSSEEGSVEVICGRGKLRLKEIEYEGIRTEKCNQIIKSIRKRLK